MIKKNTVFNKHNPKLIENVDVGINRQILAYGSDLMAVKVWFDEGAIGYEHKHHHTQISYVESGEFEVVINGEMQILGAGDSFLATLINNLLSDMEPQTALDHACAFGTLVAGSDGANPVILESDIIDLMK